MKRIFALALAIVIPSQLAANQVRQLSFDELSSQSDVVLIGEVTGVEGEDLAAIAVVRPLRVLKGDFAQSRIKVAFRTGIAEADPIDCCVKGKRYLLFVQKYQAKDLYGSTNGPFGFVPLD